MKELASERASISSVQWKSVIYIYMYVCMYSFFYGTFRSCARLLITLTVHDEQQISCRRSSPD